MAFKIFSLDENTEVTIYKRKASRSLRLSVTSSGEIRVTIPTWTPYAAGLQFAKSRMSWIKSQKKAVSTLRDGQAIGKAHHLELIASASANSVSSRLKNGSVVVRYPVGTDPNSAEVQKAAAAASIRALRIQAEKLLPQRLAKLAEVHKFNYSAVAIKLLKSRWGSCDQNKRIVLNLYLMQLPWELIDYVLLHELTHTRYLHHGPDFWSTMKQLIPNLQARRKAMRACQPMLQSTTVT